jgi:predicted small lipoprotein YifL
MMSGVLAILVSAHWRRLVLATAGVALLAACGQKGPLFLPQGDAAVGRATITEVLAPSTAVTTPTGAASAPPGTGQASPVRNP